MELVHFRSVQGTISNLTAFFSSSWLSGSHTVLTVGAFKEKSCISGLQIASRIDLPRFGPTDVKKKKIENLHDIRCKIYSFLISFDLVGITISATFARA